MTNKHDGTALLVMDVQNGIVERFISDTSTLQPFRDAVDVARKHAIPVLFIRVAFSSNYAEIGPYNKSFSQIAKRKDMAITDHATQIHDAVKPQEDETIITKYRVSAFAGSTLDVVLRANRIHKLILCGIATSGVVLSTVREAADQDFELTVLEDACLDADPEVHRVLTQKVFPRQAEVVTVADWSQSL